MAINVTQTALEYIYQHPSIVECLGEDLINYSALARRIAKAQHISSIAAVQMACRRIAKKVKVKGRQDEYLRKLLKNAKLSIRSPILVATLAKPIDFKKIIELREYIKKTRGDINIIEGEDVFTIITHEQCKEQIVKFFGDSLKEIKESLVQVTLLFGREIKTTPGVVAYVYSLLKNHNINVSEEMSCWTDLMIIIRESDLEKALSVLRGKSKR